MGRCRLSKWGEWTKETFATIKPQRSLDNWHDGYTPKWIAKPKDSVFVEYKGGEDGWNIIKALIEDNQTGFLFKYDSVEEIEKIIVKVLERKDFNIIIEKAYQYILKNKSWHKNTEIYHKIYTNLINV